MSGNAYCELAFEHLLDVDPDTLFDLVSSGALGVADMTFATEILGQSKDTARVVVTLLPLLDNPSPLVREGAMLGLANQALVSPPSDAVMARLRVLSESDPLCALRLVATDILEEFEGQ